jgi:DNA-binding CsgD family transcriptional regulator
MARLREPDGVITERELQVLEMLRRGLCPKEMAGEIGVDRTSMHYYLSSLKIRFKARHTPHLQAIAAGLDLPAIRREAAANRNHLSTAATRREAAKRAARRAAADPGAQP